MSGRNDFIWKTLNVITWIIFLGFCVQAGALLFNYIFSMFKPIATHNLHLGLDLSNLYSQSKIIYTYLFSFAIILSVLKAYLFYLVIKIFMKMNLVKPFSVEISEYISKIGYYALSIGFLGLIAHSYAKRLIQKGYDVNLIERYWHSGETYLLMAAILFVVAMIFKKGIEIQNENDLIV
ncbi:MAG: DUF2975 domain-containing protein [Bacteroidia bacterium]|nr:DUF2975 domain-containing protein [Bacteroidia bacterium]